MRGEYDARIARAKLLAPKFPASAGLLEFYIKLATLQKRIYSGLPSQPPAAHVPALLDIIRSHGPAPLVFYAEEQLQSQSQRVAVEASPEARFFARVLDQPEAEFRAAGKPADVNTPPVCPQCASKPVAAILRGEGDGAKRSLLCSLCATEWPFRRLLCPNCAEEHKDRLPVYSAEGIDHVRVEACDTCHTYLKSIDLTKDGFAVPEVDELATVTLDVWADENGYAKLEPNLLGM